MPTTTIFSTTSFDATTRTLPVITFNAAGIINNGGVGNPASLGYTAAYFDDFMERGGAATSVAGDVVIALAGGTITIDNLQLSQLNASQFDFI